MLLKDSLVFFSFIKNIFCFEKNKNSLEVFSHLITLDAKDLLSFSYEEKDTFFHNLSVLVCIIKSSVIGLKIMTLGGKIQIDEKGITVIRGEESPVEIIYYSDDFFTRLDLHKSCIEIIDFFNRKLFITHSRICRLVFILNSFIDLSDYWEPNQHLFSCVKYWNSGIGKWSRLPESRIKRMSIKEAGEIFQGLSYKIFGFNNIVNIRVTHKEVILTFKTEKNEFKARKMLLEIKRNHNKKEFKIIKEIVHKLFFLLMDEAKISELLNSNFSKVFLIKWLFKIRDFCLGHYSIKRNFQIIFSQERQQNC